MNRVLRGYAAIPPGTKVAIVTVALAAATAGTLGFEWARGPGGDHAAARQFQRMAGGLGLGATVCPRWCFVNFDPRLEHCTCAEQPLPGGYCYCPDHAGTVSFFAASGSSADRARSRGTTAP